MRLIVVRHGETKENVKGILQGQNDGVLTKKGRQQRKKVANILKNEKIDVIFSSDLKRTMHMAMEIAKRHGLQIHKTKKLRERDFGVLAGRTLEAFKEAERASGAPALKYAPKGGESFLDVKERVERFMQKLHKIHNNKTILIVTHGAIIRSLYAIYLKKPLEEVKGLKTRNAGILILSIGKSKSRKLKDTVFVRGQRSNNVRKAKAAS
jgi:broad specificity phosphatase PhoE